MNYFETLNDGAPCEGKLSCTVLSGGKSGDGIKGLPIAIFAIAAILMLLTLAINLAAEFVTRHFQKKKAL